MLTAGLGDVAGAVDVRGPETLSLTVSWASSAAQWKTAPKWLLREDLVEQRRVADVALDAGERGMRVGVGDQVDVGDGITFGEQAALQDSAEEAGTSGDEDG